MKILVLSNGGNPSEKMLSRLNALKSKMQGKYEIEFIKADSDEQKTAETILKGNYDIVLEDESITLSAWKISEICRAENSKKPIFYLDKDAKSVIDQEFKRSNFSGAYRIDFHNSQVTSSSVGLANDINKKYNIASTSKLFTAVAILQLVEKELLEFDKPIIDSISKLKEKYSFNSNEFKRIMHFENEFREHFQFTPHQLLTHTSGLDDMAGRIYEDSFGPAMIQFESAEDYVKHSAPMRDQNLESKGHHKYSNFGFFILGTAIEALTGENYHKYVNENILIPAGMQNTVPRKTDGQTFATPHFKLMPPIETPEWLLAAHDKPNTEASSIAKTALKWLEFSQEKYSSMESLVKEFQLSLAIIEAKDFPVFKNSFSQKIEKAFLDVEKYREAISEIGNIGFSLRDTVNQMSMDDPSSTLMRNLNNLVEQLYFNILHQGLCLRGFVNDLSIAHPAGCWRSTVDDMISFDRYLEKNDYLPKLMQRPVICNPSDPYDKNQYGYGCLINGNQFGHNGDTAGVHATYLRQGGYTVVTLTNNDENGHAMAEEVVRNLILGAQNNIKYFDPRVMPLAEEAFIQDVSCEFDTPLSFSSNRSSRSLIVGHPAVGSGYPLASQNNTSITSKMEPNLSDKHDDTESKNASALTAHDSTTPFNTKLTR
jgi:hypothetical protein